MLKICEMYPAIEGETSHAGLPCVIVRLAGCNLNCSFCDTPFARSSYMEMSLEQVCAFCHASDLRLVLLTGGEPLLQEETRDLMNKLIQGGFKVILETNGSIPLGEIPEGVNVILDVKCPGSGMADKNHLANLEGLRSSDEVKFVIGDRADFDFALEMVRRYALIERAGVLFSPAFGRMRPDALAGWILETRLPIRLNLQIHKYIWPPDERGR